MRMKDIESLSLAELLKLQADVVALIEQRREEQKAAVIAKLQAVASEAGYSLDELVRGAPLRAKSVKLVNSDKRSTVAPKFRDPATGTTWTGRGKKPKWVEAALASGKTLQDIAI